MEQLPDDVLVRTMKKFLGVEDVIGCRLVCKRFAALALHPDVWRGRQIYSISHRKHFEAVLHLAPCLKSFTTDMARTLITTRCAIKNLGLRVEKEDFNAAEHALVVRNQEALGRLRNLHIACYSEVTGGDALLRTLAMCCGLETLKISTCVPRTLRPVVHGTLSASLRKFNCELIPNSASFVNTILAAHSSTLEDVDLGVGPESWFLSYNEWNSDETMRLLAGIPKLRRLVSSVLPGLENVAVAARETLQSLVFAFVAKDQPAVAEAARALRKANKLDMVYLTFVDDGTDHSRPDSCGEVIEAIASPFVDYLGLRNRPPIESLARKLVGLPALSLLGMFDTPLDDELDKLLLAITPYTAPALRRLRLEEEVGGNKCTHAWMHRDAVITALSANPLLHILVEFNKMCKKDECPVCASGCHQGEDQVDWEDKCELHLFSHDLGKCPVPKDHEWNTNEIKMP
ncbi:uncharacterized protein LOC127748785 [Frankliniella occidentalis]|uniref:Uncharacterized protein LOC127748785 n=1 Tax=Frankliniella occidentalis TaxID=133901 RepID=A0A9C6TSE4_FRAOC|nr:uncharacterized protein LOC127748785 [Frankliniella occidentalis]